MSERCGFTWPRHFVHCHLDPGHLEDHEGEHRSWWTSRKFGRDGRRRKGRWETKLVHTPQVVAPAEGERCHSVCLSGNSEWDSGDVYHEHVNCRLPKGHEGKHEPVSGPYAKHLKPEVAREALERISYGEYDVNSTCMWCGESPKPLATSTPHADHCPVEIARAALASQPEVPSALNDLLFIAQVLEQEGISAPNKLAKIILILESGVSQPAATEVP